jgi:hypothetical protein
VAKQALDAQLDHDLVIEGDGLPYCGLSNRRGLGLGSEEQVCAAQRHHEEQCTAD